MNQQVIETVLKKQRGEIEKLLKKECLHRHATKKIAQGEPLQIIQGIRGAGKTFTTLHALTGKNLKFAYADLSNPLLYGLKKKDFEGLIEALIMVYDRFEYAVIDEFSSHPNWRQCIETLQEHGFKVIAITSGTVDLSDSELSYGMLNFYPLSFSEYCVWHEIEPDFRSLDKKVHVRKGFEDFLWRGGFPDMQWMERPKVASNRLLKTIFQDDIRGDFKKNTLPLIQQLAAYLVAHSATLLNYKKLAEEFEMRSEVTVKKYVEAIKGSRALCDLKRFIMHEKTRNVFEKLYLADTSFLERNEIDHALETVVFLQLRRFCDRHGYFMHYFAYRNVECNFALCVNRKMRTIIQVISDYSDSTVVKEKVAGLIALSKTTGCNRLFILTDSARDEIEEKGLSITIIPVYEFLLDRDHKIISE